MTTRAGSLSRFQEWYEDNRARFEATAQSAQAIAFNAWCASESQEHAAMQAQLDVANARVAELQAKLEKSDAVIAGLLNWGPYTTTFGYGRRCVFCDKLIGLAGDVRDPNNHAPDCEWAVVRRAYNDVIAKAKGAV
jgi:hypothetical protein